MPGQLLAVGALAAGTVIAGFFKRRGRVEEQARLALEIQPPSSDGPLPIIYGTRDVAARVSDIRVNEVVTNAGRTVVSDGVLTMVLPFAQGSRNGAGINGVQSVRFDGRAAILGPTEGTDLGGVYPRAQGVQSPWVGEGTDFPNDSWCRWGFHAGGISQVADAELKRRHPSAYTDAHRARGVAYLVLFLASKQEVYQREPAVTFKNVQGRHLYDPRDPDGGPLSDGYRFTNTSALGILDYLRDPFSGWAIPDDEIDFDNFAEEADYHERQAPRAAGGNLRLYTLDYIVDTARNVRDNLAAMLTSCRGRIVHQGGKYRLITQKTVQVGATPRITPDEIRDVVQVVRAGSAQTKNRMEITALDANADYAPKTVVWPPSASRGLPLSEDADTENPEQIELPGTTDLDRARYIAQIELAEQRASLAVRMIVSQALLTTQIGGVVRVTEPSFRWEDKPFWVQGMLHQPDDLIGLALREYDANAYLLDTLSMLEPDGDGNIPNPFVVADIEGFTLTANSTTTGPEAVLGILATWTPSTDPFVTHYEVEYRPIPEMGSPDDNAWAPGPTPRKAVRRALIWPAQNGTTYEVRMRAVNVLGIVSAPALARVLVDETVAGVLGRPTIDIDGTELKLHARFLAGRSLRYVVADVGGAPTLAAIRAGTVSTSDTTVVFTFTAGERATKLVGVLLYTDTAGTLGEGSIMILGPLTYNPGGMADLMELPTIGYDKVQPNGPAPASREAILWKAHHTSRNVAIRHRRWVAGTDPPANFTRDPETATEWAEDPHFVRVEVNRPAEGDPNVIVEAYAEAEPSTMDGDPLESVRRLAVIDAGAEPSISADIVVDPVTGQGRITPLAQDADTGSYRGWVRRAQIGSGSFPEVFPSSAETGVSEFSGSRTAGGEGGGGMIDATFDLPGGALTEGEAYFVTMVGLRTNATARAAQAMSLRSPPFQITGQVETVPGFRATIEIDPTRESGNPGVRSSGWDISLSATISKRPEVADADWTFQASVDGAFPAASPAPLVNITHNTASRTSRGTSVQLSDADYGGRTLYVRVQVGGATIATGMFAVPPVPQEATVAGDAPFVRVSVDTSTLNPTIEGPLIYRGASLPGDAPDGALGIMTSS